MNSSSFVLGLAFPLLVRSTIKRKALLPFLAIFGSLFYVGNGAGRWETKAKTLLSLVFQLAAQGQGRCIWQD